MRKLATLQQIEKLEPIKNADRIEKASIKGWDVVVQRGLYTVGSWVVFHEIDSAFPVGLEPYHSDLAVRGTKETQLEDESIVKVYVIKSLKLRDVISQGYCVPISKYSEEIQQELNKNLKKDFDVTKLLGVLKYEKPEPKGSVAYVPKTKKEIFKFKFRKWLERNLPTFFKPQKTSGHFPVWIKKTDAVRIQNYKQEMYAKYLANKVFNVTYKLDGSSITIAKKDKKLYTCSRNLNKNLKITNDSFVRVSLPIHESLKKQATQYCFQGEFVSPSIQQNFEGVSKEEVYIFSAWDITNQVHLNPLEVIRLCKLYKLKHVPVLHEKITLKELFPNVIDADDLLKQMLKYADGPSGLKGKYREGLVYKECEDGYLPIKTISNSYLLKYKDEE